MKNILLIFIVSLLYINIAGSEKDNLIKKGIHLSYNFQLTEAEQIFNKLIDDYPNEPDGYLLLSQNYLWKFLGNKDEGEFKTFLKFIEISIEKLKSKIKKSPKQDLLNYQLGKAYMFKAMALTTNGSNVDAFWATKTSMSYFDDVLEETPTFYDANLGIGVFQYALGYVPSVFKWALTLTGLSADKDKGLDNILIAFKKGTDSKTEAAFHLGKIYSDYLAEYDSSSFYLYNIINKYPKNTLFLYQCAITHLLDRDLTNSEKLLNKVISLNNKYFTQTTAFAYFLKGDIYFRRNNYEKAIENYKKFFDLTKVTDYLGIANFRLSFCYEMLNKDEESSKCISNVSLGNDDIQDDIYAKNEGKKIKEYGWSNDRKIIMVANNYLEAGIYDSVISNLKEKLTKIKDEDYKIIGNLFLAESFIKKNKIDSSNDIISKLSIKKLDREKWGIPLYYYLKALISYKNGKNSEALKQLELAEDNNDYYFKEKYQPLINNLINRLKK